jgi:hypothetical protein
MIHHDLIRKHGNKGSGIPAGPFFDAFLQGAGAQIPLAEYINPNDGYGWNVTETNYGDAVAGNGILTNVFGQPQAWATRDLGSKTCYIVTNTQHTNTLKGMHGRFGCDADGSLLTGTLQFSYTRQSQRQYIYQWDGAAYQELASVYSGNSNSRTRLFEVKGDGQVNMNDGIYVCSGNLILPIPDTYIGLNCLYDNGVYWRDIDAKTVAP